MSKNLRNEIVQHRQYEGGHALTKERFDDIIKWLETHSENCPITIEKKGRTT